MLGKNKADRKGEGIVNGYYDYSWWGSQRKYLSY